MAKTGERSRSQSDFHAIQLALYCDIAECILDDDLSLSTTKLILFSFLAKCRRIKSRRSYDGRPKADLLSKVTCEAAGSFNLLLVDLPFIVEALSLLLGANRLVYDENGLIRLNVESGLDKCFDDTLMRKLVKQSVDFDDSFVLQEVLRNV